jgi:hypothetical protein
MPRIDVSMSDDRADIQIRFCPHLRDSKYFILSEQGTRTYKSAANTRHLNHDDRRYSLGSENVERVRQLFSRERE